MFNIPSAQAVNHSQQVVNQQVNAEYRRPYYNPYKEGLPGVSKVSALETQLKEQMKVPEDTSGNDLRCLDKLVQTATHYTSFDDGRAFVKPSDPEIKVGERTFVCHDVSLALIQALKGKGYRVETDPETKESKTHI